MKYELLYILFFFDIFAYSCNKCKPPFPLTNMVLFFLQNMIFYSDFKRQVHSVFVASAAVLVFLFHSHKEQNKKNNEQNKKNNEQNKKNKELERKLRDIEMLFAARELVTGFHNELTYYLNQKTSKVNRTESLKPHLKRLREKPYTYNVGSPLKIGEDLVRLTMKLKERVCKDGNEWAHNRCFNKLKDSVIPYIMHFFRPDDDVTVCTQLVEKFEDFTDETTDERRRHLNYPKNRVYSTSMNSTSSDMIRMTTFSHSLAIHQENIAPLSLCRKGYIYVNRFLIRLF